MPFTLLKWASVGILVVIGLALIARRRTLLAQETSGSIQINLSKSPNHATGSEIGLLALKAASKHVLALIGCTPTMKPDPRYPQKIKLPYIFMQGLLHINENDKRMYNKAVKSNTADNIINPMFLVAQTLPLMIHILADRACPVLPLGSVNTRNTFKIRRPHLAQDIGALRRASQDGNLSYEVYFGGHDRPGYRRKRGVEFCITIVVRYEGEPEITMDLWVLQFMPESFEPCYIPDSVDQDQKALEENSDGADLHKIRIDTRDPHDWAASTKDYNPIHVSPIGAKLFGFKSVIAHGNHLVALAVEKLRDEAIKGGSGPASKARQMLCEGADPITLEARFVRPTSLPAESSITWQGFEKNKSEIRYEMKSRDKVCVLGSLSPGEEYISWESIPAPIR